MEFFSLLLPSFQLVSVGARNVFVELLKNFVVELADLLLDLSGKGGSCGLQFESFLNFGVHVEVFELLGLLLQMDPVVFHFVLLFLQGFFNLANFLIAQLCDLVFVQCHFKVALDFLEFDNLLLQNHDLPRRDLVLELLNRLERVIDHSLFLVVRSVLDVRPAVFFEEAGLAFNFGQLLLVYGSLMLEFFNGLLHINFADLNADKVNFGAD